MSFSKVVSLDIPVLTQISWASVMYSPIMVTQDNYALVHTMNCFLHPEFFESKLSQ
jgi:hypothetical protein